MDLASDGNYHVAPITVTLLKMVTCISGTICFIIFIVTLQSVLSFHDEKITLKSVKWFSSLSLFSFSVCLFGQSANQLLRDDTMQVAPDHWYILTVVCIPLSAWTFGEFFMYLLFMSNLHYTFEHTIFRVSRYAFTILTFLIILFVILRFLYIIFYIAYYIGWVTNAYFSYRAAVIVSLTEAIDFIISVNLLYLFVNRLFKLYIITNQNLVGSSNNLKQNRYKQESILSVASKYSILSFLAIFSTQLFLVAAVNNDFSMYIPHSSWYIYGYIAYSCLLSFNCIINSVCIFLNLEVNSVYYYMICSACDNCCYKCCIGVSKKYSLNKDGQRKFSVKSASKTDLHIVDDRKGFVNSSKQILINTEASINSTKSKRDTYYNNSRYHAIDNMMPVTPTCTDGSNI